MYRKDTPEAPFVQVWPLWLPQSSFVDRTAPAGQTPIYVVRAVDASGNVSPPTPEQAPSAAGRTVGR